MLQAEEVVANAGEPLHEGGLGTAGMVAGPWLVAAEDLVGDGFGGVATQKAVALLVWGAGERAEDFGIAEAAVAEGAVNKAGADVGFERTDGGGRRVIEVEC